LGIGQRADFSELPQCWPVPIPDLLVGTGDPLLAESVTIIEVGNDYPGNFHQDALTIKKHLLSDIAPRLLQVSTNFSAIV